MPAENLLVSEGNLSLQSTYNESLTIDFSYKDGSGRFGDVQKGFLIVLLAERSQKSDAIVELAWKYKNPNL